MDWKLSSKHTLLKWFPSHCYFSLSLSCVPVSTKKSLKKNNTVAQTLAPFSHFLRLGSHSQPLLSYSLLLSCEFILMIRTAWLRILFSLFAHAAAAGWWHSSLRIQFLPISQTLLAHSFACFSLLLFPKADSPRVRAKLIQVKGLSNSL